MSSGNLDLSIRINADGTAAITGLRRVDDQLDEIDETARRASAGLAGIGGAIKGAVAAAAGFVALDALVGSFMSVNVETGRLRASLTAVTGSVESAGMAWDSLVQFARETPYSLSQSVAGFTKLKALGLDPTIAAMRDYGNLAAAMGGDMEQAVEAVADAVTSEFERLKAFGIKTSVQGEQVAMTFQNVTTVIENNAKAIEAYIRQVAAAKFGDAMKLQADTLGGALNNLQDDWDGLMRALGDTGSTNLAARAIRDLSWALQELANQMTDPHLSIAAGQWEGDLRRVHDRVADLKEKLADLQSMGGMEKWAGGWNDASIAERIKTIREELAGLARERAQYIELAAADRETLAIPVAGPSLEELKAKEEAQQAIQKLVDTYLTGEKKARDFAEAQKLVNDAVASGAISAERGAEVLKAMAAALFEQAGATDKLTKAQRESNAELADYAERAGNVLGLSQRQKQVMIETLPAIQSASKAFGVPQDVIMSIIDVESAWKKAAYNSKASATGMMQIIPSTARMIAKETGLAFEDIMTKPAANIEAGTYLIGKLIAKYGDLETALRAYNAGEGRRLKSSYGWKETNDYVRDVTANVAKLGPIGEGAADVFAAIRTNVEATAKATEQARDEIARIIEDSYDDLTKEEIRYQRDLATLAAAQIDNVEMAAAARLAIEQRHAEALRQIQKDQAGPMEQYLDGLREGMGSLETLAVDAMDGFNNALVDGLVDGRFEFDDFVDDIKRTLAKMAVDTIVLKFAGQILGVTGGTGAGGALQTVTGATGATGGQSWIGNAISGASSLYNGYQWLVAGGNVATLGTAAGLNYGTGAFSQQSAMLAAQESGMGFNAGAGYGSGGGAWMTAGAGLAGGLAGSYLAGQMFDGQYVSTGSAVGGMGGAYLGATYGSAFGPIGTAAGALIGSIAGGAIASLFGGDQTPKQGSYATSFSGFGFEDNAKAKGAFGLNFGLTDKGSKNIKASEFQGTFDAMAELSNSVAQFYGPELSEKVQVSLRASLGDFKGYGPDVNLAIDEIFDRIVNAASEAEGQVGEGMGHLLKVAVGDLGGTANAVAQQLDAGMVKVRAAVSLFDTDLGKRLGLGTEAYYSTLEAAVGAMSGYVTTFAQSGESAAHTLERLLTGAAAFEQAAQLTGASLDHLDGNAFLHLGQAFVSIMTEVGLSLDGLTSLTDTYYSHFFSAEEQAERKRKAALVSIDAWSASIGKTGEAAVDTSAEFRAYIDALDLTDEAQLRAYLTAMQLVPAFVSLDEALGGLGETVEATLASVTDFIDSIKPDALKQSDALKEMMDLFATWGMSLPPTADALYALIQAGAFTAAQLQIFANNAETLGIAWAGIAAAQQAALKALEDTYNAAVAAAREASSVKIAALREESNARIEALREASSARIEALNDAYSTLTDGLNDSLGAAQDALSLFGNLVKSAADALRKLTESTDGIDETRQRALAEARAALEQYRRDGTLPEDVTDIVGRLDTVDANDFATRDDWLAAIAENQRLIEELKQAGAAGLSEGERQIALIEAQLEQAKTQHEAALKAEESALKALLAGLEAEFEAQRDTLMTDTNALLQEILDALGRPPAEAPDREPMPDFVARMEALVGALSQDTRATAWKDVQALVSNDGAKSLPMPELGFRGDYDKLSTLLRIWQGQDLLDGTDREDIIALLGKLGISIPGFAAGGVHAGGLRLVGEHGPEIEYTGPSVIAPNRSLSGLFKDGNGELVAEVRALQRDAREARAVNAAQAASLAELLKLHKRWNAEGLPPDKMDYAKTVAEAA
ncbi:transglycosylase SLT domain-containing protein [uncultured Thiocystis sp.]|jgi:soluble lytic murein transglycosylase-like protein|uniref:transglycosylase SLT domain-containing protein n=1 Tax=uncultured Thiocystis sp. TaxID=1202134 RepID=UPI0025E32EA8|nr:transglycosylase SLT domain-containing protein [uncultured Thiocystis sp.]